MSKGKTAQVVLTVDVVALRQGAKGLEVLLIKRGKAPFCGQWALPGGKIDESDTTLTEAALRELCEETGIQPRAVGMMRQVATFGESRRDPRGRYVSVLYLASVRPGTVVRAGDDAAFAQWFALSHIPHALAFDHERLLSAALHVAQGC